MLSNSSPSLRSPAIAGNAVASTVNNDNGNGQAPPQLAFSSSYPNPPMQYINLFSDENIAKGKCPEPPKPIVEGTEKICFKLGQNCSKINNGSYTMFGVSMTNDEAIIRPLESQGIKRLYPRDYDHKRELKKMNASILVNFLDLLDVLVKCPDTGKREEKCSDIAMLFVQMHHLINELRPHQGRETIRVTLQCQKRQRLEIINKLNKQIDRVNELVTNCINAIPESKVNISETDVEMKSEEPNNQIDLLDQLAQLKQKNLDSASSHLIDQLDFLMCSIVDEM